jgi:hypothetical protein
MPRLTGLLLTPGGAPMEVGLKVGRNNLPEVIQQVLGCQKVPVVSNCQLGVLYSSGDSEVSQQPRNELATQLCSKYSRKMPDTLTLTHGRCFLVGEDEKGATTHINKQALQTVLDLYKELTGHTVSGSKTVKTRVGPKRPKRDYDYFSGVFSKSRRAELAAQNIVPVFADITREARDAWKTMSSEEKAPYMAKAAEDRIRYEKEKNEYNQKNPPRPKNPRNAYNVFCQEYPDKATRPDWKTWDAQLKVPFEAKAAEDKLRYEKELDVFRQHCVATGKDYEALIARKKRSRSDDENEQAPKKKKAKTSGDGSTVKKTKSDSDATPKKKRSKSTSEGGSTKKKKTTSKADKKSKKGKAGKEDKEDEEEPMEEDEAPEESEASEPSDQDE